MDGDIVRWAQGNFKSVKLLSAFAHSNVITEMKAGDKFHVGETEHSLGHKLGSTGSTGSVHHLEGHPEKVAKVFHKDSGVAPKARNKEI